MTTTELTADEEYRRALRKHATWLEEISAWKSDHELALTTLEQAMAFVREHDALLDHHAETIAEYDATVAAQSLDQNGATTAAEHQRLEDLHRIVLEQHNRFRGRHPALIQQIAQLAVELHKVSHQPG